MFSLHCFEGLEIKNCCGRKRKKDDDSNAGKKETQIVVNVNSKNKDVNGVAADVSSFAPSSIDIPKAVRRHKHKRHRRPGRVYPFSVSSESMSSTSLRHRRRSNASGSVIVRETLAMVNTVDNWLACLTQGNVDFALPAKPQSVLGTCLISPQRQVMSLNGFGAYLSDAPTSEHINDVFQTHFASLVLSLVDKCFAQNIASAIRIVNRRQPFNVVAYPITVRTTVEGVLLIYREDQVTPAEFNNLIVSAT